MKKRERLFANYKIAFKLFTQKQIRNHKNYGQKKKVSEIIGLRKKNVIKYMFM